MSSSPSGRGSGAVRPGSRVDTGKVAERQRCDRSRALPLQRSRAARPGQRNFPWPDRRQGAAESRRAAARWRPRGAEREAQARELGRQQGEAECAGKV